MKNKKTLIVLSIISLVITILVITNNFTSIDNSVYTFINSFNSEFLTKLMLAYTNIGGTYIILIIALITVIMLKKQSIYALIVLLDITITNQLLKYIFAIPRPTDINTYTEHGYSFPSGHAMVSTAFYGYLTYIILQNTKKEHHKYIITLSTVLIVLIGISRIYLGVHYFSDVLVGHLLGIIYLILFINITKKTS